MNCQNNNADKIAENTQEFIETVSGKKNEFAYLHGLLIAGMITDLPFNAIAIAEQMDALIQSKKKGE